LRMVLVEPGPESHLDPRFLLNVFAVTWACFHEKNTSQVKRRKEE
jgi:hypothetical protein